MVRFKTKDDLEVLTQDEVIERLNQGASIDYDGINRGLILFQDGIEQGFSLSLLTFLNLRDLKIIEHVHTMRQGHFLFHGRVDQYKLVKNDE